MVGKGDSCLFFPCKFAYFQRQNVAQICFREKLKLDELQLCHMEAATHSVRSTSQWYLPAFPTQNCNELMFTLPETNTVHEKLWFGDYFPFANAYMLVLGY